MPTYTVKQGECLSSIAKKYGFADWRTIYNRVENTEFRAKRPNPNLIYPGDQLYIPLFKPKYETIPTGSCSVFTLLEGKTFLRLIITDEQGDVASEKKYSLTVEGSSWDGLTGADGLIQKQIPPDARRGRLQVWTDPDDSEPDVWDLQIGSLDPVDEDSGVRGRLNNLGYACGKVDQDNGQYVKTAVTAFQRRSGMEASGEVTDDVRNALRNKHKC